ncbi:MAG TPA: hypothetical protein VGR47_14350 [Terracidiphilus sp.]|nr:hypothetical protein [Terracidiphilus sp.]
MMKRIGIWAFAGFGVAVCWAFFAALTSYFGHPYDLYHWPALRLIFPLSWFGRIRIRMTYYEAILLNAASYALIGLVTEPFWRRSH